MAFIWVTQGYGDRGVRGTLQCAAVLVTRILVLLSALVLMTPNVALADGWFLEGLQRRALEPPYRTQLDDSMYARSDCGPAVLGMALAAYGIERETLELRELTHTYQGTWPAVRVGTALQHMAHVAEDFGLRASGLYESNATDGEFHRWSLGELTQQVRAGRIAVPLVRFGLLPGHETSGVRWGHYILLYAIEGDGFLYQDPAMRPIDEGRARWISWTQLDEAMAPVWPPRQALVLG
jgi:Peptidase_C39 like family